MNRIFIFTLCILLFAFSFLGCSSPKQSTESNSISDENQRIKVVSSFFPLYDFVRMIGGDHVNVTNMVPAGVEPHDWTPKSQDMKLISEADLFIYQGAGFEGWIDDVLSGISSENLLIIEASNGIELLPSTPEPEEHEHHGHDHEELENDQRSELHDHGAYDPHTWLSPKSAIRMAENIFIGMKQADPAHASDYDANFNKLNSELTKLEQQYASQLTNLTKKEIVVSHQAFGYLARDYGLVQMPLMGIAAESEPTAQSLKAISEFVREHEVKYIFTEQLLSDALARTLADDLGVNTLMLHPLEGLTSDEMTRNETYISLMEHNLNQLMKALR